MDARYEVAGNYVDTGPHDNMSQESNGALKSRYFQYALETAVLSAHSAWKTIYLLNKQDRVYSLQCREILDSIEGGPTEEDSDASRCERDVPPESVWNNGRSSMSNLVPHPHRESSQQD